MTQLGGREFYYRWRWELDGTPEQLWPYVSDTNRFNSDVGLGRLTLNERVQTGLERRLRFQQFGFFPIEWTEEPFDWVYASTFGVQRRYSRGPVASMQVLATLMPINPSTTELVYEVWAKPRNLLGTMAIPVVIGWQSQRKFGRVFKLYADRVKDMAEPVDSSSSAVNRISRAERNQLEARQNTLIGLGANRELLDKLIRLIVERDDFDLLKIRPYLLADQWNEPRVDVLNLFLLATKHGLLDMEWQLLCPLCRGAGDNVTSTLETVDSTVHCDSCLVDYEVNFDQGVELIFRPNPAIRPLEMVQFCVGGPQITPHIIAQQILLPGEQRSMALALSPGRYRIRFTNSRAARSLLVDPSGKSVLAINSNLLLQSAENELTAAPHITFEITNTNSGHEQLIIERTAWSDSAVTASEVIANQAFRDLFSDQVLRPDIQFSVGRTTIVFTDLVGSTQLYNEIGDAPAFGLVLNHFDILKNAIAKHDGAIIKTIGDAIMAGFRNPANALEAILEAQCHLQEQAEQKGERELLLKASVHTGRCIAVTLNGRLDYFGSTVNMASRLEAFASPSAIVISDEVYKDPSVREMLARTNYQIKIQSFSEMLKGYENESFQLWRLEIGQPKA